MPEIGQSYNLNTPYNTVIVTDTVRKWIYVEPAEGAAFDTDGRDNAPPNRIKAKHWVNKLKPEADDAE